MSEEQKPLWVVKRVSRDHAEIHEGNKWIATARVELAEEIAKWHNDALNKEAA